MMHKYFNSASKFALVPDIQGCVPPPLLQSQVYNYKLQIITTARAKRLINSLQNINIRYCEGRGHLFFKFKTVKTPPLDCNSSLKEKSTSKMIFSPKCICVL